MPNYISVQSSIPASETRPEFAEWFANIKRINNLNPVYQRRLNALYALRCMGVNATLVTIVNNSCSLVITGVAIGEDNNPKSITINKSSSLWKLR